MDATQHWFATLKWNASLRQWIARTENGIISVNESAYDRYMNEYLISQGIERKTWTQYIYPAEEAWKRQCEAEERLLANGVPAWKIKEQLRSQGIIWKTWTQYICPAEEAWKRQCALQDRLNTDIDFWRSVAQTQAAACIFRGS
ncbi:MAG TPA: hypothetical protein VEL31_30070 [Ktedonobacteraceae bacterium]|nr:hypothetical protein [Ktedonobacteraceae bacterium]